MAREVVAGDGVFGVAVGAGHSTGDIEDGVFVEGGWCIVNFEDEVCGGTIGTRNNITGDITHAGRT